MQTLSKQLGDGDELKVGELSYRIYEHELMAIGAEAGSYIYGNMTITLDGVNIATITGSNAGNYYYVAHADHIVTIVLDNDLIVFDYTQADSRHDGKYVV